MQFKLGQLLGLPILVVLGIPVFKKIVVPIFEIRGDLLKAFVAPWYADCWFLDVHWPYQESIPDLMHRIEDVRVFVILVSLIVGLICWVVLHGFFTWWVTSLTLYVFTGKNLNYRISVSDVIASRESKKKARTKRLLEEKTLKVVRHNDQETGE